MTSRPPVSVVVPFSGSEHELDAVIAALESLRRVPGDELIVADNRATAAQARRIGADVLLHPASAIASPGFARNRGAAVATRDWLVFIDADTTPAPDLLDAYFCPPPAPGTALLAGAIRDLADPTRSSWVARHAVARAQMDQAVTLDRERYPYAQSANIAVSREALIRVGGFEEHARAAEDADLCFRLAELGLGVEVRPHAVVGHHARTNLSAALTQLIRHGAGAAWCEARHPGSFPAEPPNRLLRRIGHSLITATVAAARADGERATFSLLEIAETVAFALGRVLPNRPAWRLRR